MSVIRTPPPQASSSRSFPRAPSRSISRHSERRSHHGDNTYSLPLTEFNTTADLTQQTVIHPRGEIVSRPQSRATQVSRHSVFEERGCSQSPRGIIQPGIFPPPLPVSFTLPPAHVGTRSVQAPSPRRELINPEQTVAFDQTMHQGAPDKFPALEGYRGPIPESDIIGDLLGASARKES